MSEISQSPKADDTATLSRRRFLQVMSASVAMVSLAGCRWPEEKIVPYANRPDGATPGKPLQFATTMELGPVALGVLVVLAALNLVRDNRRGLVGAFVVMAGGMVLLGGATALLDAGAIGGVTWMVLVGLGSYLAYVPFGTVLFERMIAHTRAAGNVVFAIYLMDAVGYTGSVGTMLFKDLGQAELSHLSFIRTFSYGLALAGVVADLFHGSEGLLREPYHQCDRDRV